MHHCMPSEKVPKQCDTSLVQDLANSAGGAEAIAVRRKRCKLHQVWDRGPAIPSFVCLDAHVASATLDLSSLEVDLGCIMLKGTLSRHLCSSLAYRSSAEITVDSFYLGTIVSASWVKDT